MKLILNTGIIALVDVYNPLLGVGADISLDLKYVDGMHIHFLEYSFGGEFQPVIDNTIKIPEGLGSQGVVITINKRKIGTDRLIETFKSDELPVTKYVLFGKPIETAYPITLTNILNRLEKAEARLEELETSGDLL